MKICLLTENRTRKKGFLAEHGLSIYIEHENKSLLFDTGQSSVYTHNAFKNGIDLQHLDAIILSHGHYDHCGGFMHFPYLDKLPPIYLKKESLEVKYRIDGEEIREIGINWSQEFTRQVKNKFVYCSTKEEIFKGIFVLSEIPYTTAFEEKPKGFLKNQEGKVVEDTLQEEQILVIEEKEGLHVFLGCSHVGIINCIHYVLQQFPNKPIHTLLAGMHLENAKKEKIDQTLEALSHFSIDTIIPLHCTGVVVSAKLKELFKERCTLLQAGEWLETML